MPDEGFPLPPGLAMLFAVVRDEEYIIMALMESGEVRRLRLPIVELGEVCDGFSLNPWLLDDNA
jgi:hypothetical protein